jgi:hypothetical protein
MKYRPLRSPDPRSLAPTPAVNLLVFGLVKADAQGLASIPLGPNSPIEFAIKRQHPDDPRLVHGALTYDYFAMIRAIATRDCARQAGGLDGGPMFRWRCSLSSPHKWCPWRVIKYAVAPRTGKGSLFDRVIRQWPFDFICP